MLLQTPIPFLAALINISVHVSPSWVSLLHSEQHLVHLYQGDIDQEDKLVHSIPVHMRGEDIIHGLAMDQYTNIYFIVIRR